MIPKKTKTSLLSLLACLYAGVALAQTPPILFQDDFDTAEPGGPPSSDIWGEGAVGTQSAGQTQWDHQWVRVTSDDDGTYFETPGNNYLHVYADGTPNSSASHWITTTNNQFAGSNVISVHFDYRRADAVGTNNPGLRLGKDNPVSSSRNSTRYTLRIQDNLVAGEAVAANNVTHNLQWVYNNTATPVTYLDGKATVYPNSYDIWIDGERVVTNGKHGSNSNSTIDLGDPITSFGIGVWGEAAVDFRLDNLVIYEGAYAIGNPPPDEIIFADDFSQSEVQGSPNDMLLQPLADTWKRSPTSVAYPDNIIEVTAHNSELYFGEPNNDYLRFFKAYGTPDNLHLTTENGFSPASSIVTISFDFYEPAGIGGNPDVFEIIPGRNTANSPNRIHKVTMSNGRINGKSDLYKEGVKNNIQLVFNNSLEPVSYLNGAVTLDSDRFDVWINGRRVLENAINRTGISETNPMPVGDPLSSVQFIIWANSDPATRYQEFFLDNLEVFNHPHVKNGDPTPYPTFADDFSEPVAGKPDIGIWGAGVTNASPPNRVIEVTDADSETYFGETGNNYMRVFNDGTEDTSVNLTAHSRFNSEVITISFDFFEPEGVGAGDFVLRPGYGNAPNSHRIHEISFNNGNLSGVAGAYTPGQRHNIQIVMNNSAETVVYHGGTAAVESDKYDVWIDGEPVVSNHTQNRGFYPVGSPLTSVMFIIWGGTSNEFLIDNLEIFERPVVRTPGSDQGVTFADWAALHLPEGLRGPGDDAAGDGIPNIIKFALGLDPLTPDRASLPVASTVTDNGETRLTITSQRFINAADVELVVESSSDLIDWTPLDVEPELIETLSEEIELIRVTDTETINGASRRFLRLKVLQK